MKQKKLYNPDANIKAERKLINGETTNILDLVNVKYPQFLEYVDIAYANNWHFRKPDLSNDRKQYENVLTDEEREAFDNVISFLIFLDSLQTNNLPNIAEFITLPEIVYWLGRQTWDEALHSRSYAHVLSNAVPPDSIERITYKYRENKILAERNKAIAEIYEENIEHPSELNFVKTIVANYLLEGLYFYNGFQFFHNLASRGLMVGTDTEIKYIQRDEMVHCTAFADIINISQKENPEIWTDKTKEIVYNMFRKAAELEIKFSNDAIGDKILGITSKAIEDYTYYLGNKRLKDIGLEQIFPHVKKNPYLHLEKIAAIDDETSSRVNNFEATSITYKDPSIFDGWEDV